DYAGTRITGETYRLDVMGNDFDINGDDFDIDSFDGVSALGGTITRSVGTGPGGRDELLYSAPASAGMDSFSYTLRDATDRTDSATVTILLADGSAFRDPDSVPVPVDGVVAAYYALPPLSQLPYF